MSVLESDAVTAATGTNTNLALTGKGTGKVALGDAALLVPDADGAAGQILTTNGSLALTFAATPGTSGNVLTSNGSAWTSAAAAAGGAWAVIASGTASTVTVLDFTSGFTAGKIQKIFIHDLIVTAGRRLVFRTSTGGTFESATDDYGSAFSSVIIAAEAHSVLAVAGGETYMVASGSGDTLSTAVFSAVMEIVIQGHGDSGQYTTVSWRMNMQSPDVWNGWHRAEGVGTRTTDQVDDGLRLTLDNTSGATFTCKYVHLELN